MTTSFEPHEDSESAAWYHDAIIYEVHVRAFADANSDGIGDFRGLTSKLDYLRDLGVTALWLLPFYPSPLRDDGYDIADYMSINPSYGTMADFRLFMREAHKRDLKVITELVINHTSDQHPWFQRARKAPPNSPERDFYVWSDDPELYKDARVIFQDTETSNWSWDPVANAYYWHRFFSHQPDLNFENPAVHEAIFGALDFWLAAGVDGLRLDAVPYLYERDGTMCENLPETHGFLKELRSRVDAKYDDRLLLAEANQWPEEAAAYFGDGDECHMCFHFPLMPRLFMSLRMENRFPIIDIVEQTPPIPENGAWAIFLRNHDELTLEMVTDEERDYMYRVYADDPQTRINVGIRRRLAPLLGNNRREMELMNALLLSLPGTPVLYYGDEIGMGDNVYLGDRNGVRTPMQWSGDRNAGFSDANPQRLYFPVITDPEYHYETVNVEVQRDNPNSMWWWVKRALTLRKGMPELSRGGLEFVPNENPKVLTYLRSLGERSVLVVANLSAPYPAGRARPHGVRGGGAGRAVRSYALPWDRRSSLPAHPRASRFLLVRAGSGGRQGRRAGRAATGHNPWRAGWHLPRHRTTRRRPAGRHREQAMVSQQGANDQRRSHRRPGPPPRHRFDDRLPPGGLLGAGLPRSTPGRSPSHRGSRL